MKLRKFLSVTTLMFSAISSNAYTQATQHDCIPLTKEVIEDLLNNGGIITHQTYTLADEIGKTRPQVLIDEPTANPFDTYHALYSLKIIEGNRYWIEVNYVLGKDFHEAKDRTKQILLGNNETKLEGTYNKDYGICIYKNIDASEDIPNFPFKSRAESIMMFVFPLGGLPAETSSKTPAWLSKKLAKIHRLNSNNPFYKHNPR